MWLSYALASALFAGVMSILAKIGIRDTDSNVATALRTVVVAAFAWLMVIVAGSQSGISDIDAKSLLFLVLSGLATGGSWLCYFKALQLGDVNKVIPVDKASVVLTMLLAFLFLDEPLTPIKAAAMALIGAGTYLMIERREAAPAGKRGPGWLIYAVLSAVFASLTAILGKVGITGVESNLGTAIRTLVVLVMAWMIVVMQGKLREVRRIDRRSWVFICFSGIATGLSWLCFYRALQEGPASVVVPVDKLSILVTIAFGRLILHEKLKKLPAAGLAMIVLGTLGMVI